MYTISVLIHSGIGIVRGNAAPYSWPKIKEAQVVVLSYRKIFFKTRVIRKYRNRGFEEII